RPEHDDRDRPWRGGMGSWRPQAGRARGGVGASVRSGAGVMARGRGARDESASELAAAAAAAAVTAASSYRERNRGRLEPGRRRGGDDSSGEESDDKYGRRSPRQAYPSFAPANFLNHVFRCCRARSGFNRRGSRSRSPSCRRSRSRDKAVSGLLNDIMGRGSSPGGEGRRDNDDYVKTWTHDLYEEIAGADSPPRPKLPPGYKPEPEAWVSRAGGVYVPLKPA
ncbi:unnamed protein product, partial [Hapterophycus canaliculatus]